MFSFFMNLNYYYQALIAGIFTFLITTLGSSFVFFFKKDNKKLFNIMLALSSGIMLSASFFSLINPALELCNTLNMKSYIVCFTGIMFGTIVLLILNKTTSKSNKLLLSITMHNIPEGLSIGVSFGSIFYHVVNANLAGALILTLGIAIQNFPEGFAVSMPLYNNGTPKFKSFLYGSLTAIVEPVFALIGAILVMKIQIILPFCLTFAAGAMIYVVLSELLPSCLEKNNDIDNMSFFIICGFSLMMILEIIFS